MTARTYALTRVGHLTQLVTVEADVTEGLPATVLRGLPDDSLREARDRIRAAIVNSGEQWPTAKITVSLPPARTLGRTSNLDLAIGMAILAAAGDVPHVQLASMLFLAELGLDGRLRSVVDIAEVLAAATRNELPPITRDDAFTLVVPTQDAPAAVDAIACRQAPYVRVVGAQHLTDVVAWLRSAARLGRLTLAEDPDGMTGLCTCRSAVLLDDISWYPAALLDVDVLLPGPGSHRGRINGVGTAADAVWRTASSAAHLAAVLNVLGERRAQFFAVVCAQVNLVFGAVKSEVDGAFGLAAVEVVDKQRLNLLGHGLLLSL